MEQKNIHKIVTPIGVLLIILFLAACSAPAPSSPTETQSSATQAPQATATEVPTESPSTATTDKTPAVVQDLCANNDYPVREGSTWTYKSTGSPLGDYSYTDT